MQETEEISVTDIAIIGMAGSFPGARDIEQFWQNIRAGYEAVSTFGDEEVLAAGIPASLVHHQDYVKAGGVLDDVELFDAAFFNYSPVEATLMDPQQRLFLECSYTALENAGYDPWRYAGRIGVYGGASTNTYLLLNLLPHFNLYLDSTRLLVGNEKDFLTSRVSFQLNLRGPSVSLQAGCATSLFAIHLACQALQNAECDIALAGGVSIVVPQKAGFLYREGGVWCSDGHCRAFDAKADGMFPGNGVGVVVLKRLADALADHDGIHALIKGSAVTNDGQTKMSFAAPSVQGEAMAVADALAIADINPETISYIEAHGTATPLGDPIEVAALSEVFQAATTRKQFCALGSVKTNIGHLDAAAGIAGLIKTVLALENKELPPSINFEQPNPRINFADSPFYVNTTLTPWQTDGTPRRAGVSSFSVGGHNAHIILQEAPSRPPSGPGRSWQLLLLSAKTASALETLTMNLAKALQVHPHLPLADVAYTLHIGRQVFPHRRAIICRDREDALSALTSRNPDVVFTAQQQQRSAQVAFLFPGQGAQYLQMARDLYQSEAVFRDCFDQCAELLEPWLHLNMRTLLYPDASSGEEASKQLNQVQYAQVALFVIEYALAQQWMAWGIQPAAMIGHSIGEYTAACLAGVFSLADALALVAYRGQLMQSVPPGAMLAVALPEKFARLLIDESLSIAAVNEPTQCVIAGPILDIERLQHRLRAHGIEHQRLHVSHAMHSSMMDGIVNRFIERVRQKELKAPKIPFISSATGTWITAEEATSPAYWGQHLRQTVRFFDGLQTLLQEKVTVLLEVGPGRTLSTLARRHPALKNEQVVIQSIRHISEQKDDLAFLLTALGKLWLAGVAIDCAAFFADEQRYRVPLPTYPFEKQRYWLDPPATLENGLKQETIQEVRALETQQPGDTSTQVEAASQLSSNGRQHLQTTYVAPRNEKEQILVSIWQRFLGIEPVGIYDNFFELGGNSLMALQVNTEVRERFAVDLALQHFLTEAPTIIRLAETIEALQARKNGFQLASLPQERE